MMDIFHQGRCKLKQTQRRVDVARGRVIVDGNGPKLPADPRWKRKVEARLAAYPSMLTSTLALIVRAAPLIVLLLAGFLLLPGCASQSTSSEPSIEIEAVRMTAAGHYIDLRYRVLDAERANASLGPGVKPTLIDDATGAVMAVPMTAKLGSLRQTRGIQRPDRTYFVLFANTAGVKAGSVVTAQMGDMRFESLTIE
jgi:hypothetical protein